ncbi:hypothetical protein N7527_010461 [Penicillium freii]|nr:hypothetical protein N7527_010461 [Penicillium freii]
MTRPLKRKIALKRLSIVSQLTNYLEISPHFAAIHHGDDTIHPGDTDCSMRHTEDHTIPEGPLQGSLDPLIHALVNIRRYLIEHQDTRPRQQLRLTRG